MKKVFFRLAGNRVHDRNTAYLMSKHRVRVSDTIFHRNDYTTEYCIPYDVFKYCFKYDRETGIYKTLLTYNDLKEYATLIEH